MASFSLRELRVCQAIGAVVFGISVVMAVVGGVGVKGEMGVPEFMRFTMLMGFALMAPSLLLFGIATAKVLMGPPVE